MISVARKRRNESTKLYKSVMSNVVHGYAIVLLENTLPQAALYRAALTKARCDLVSVGAGVCLNDPKVFPPSCRLAGAMPPRLFGQSICPGNGGPRKGR
jgi:hypothetical protein